MRACSLPRWTKKRPPGGSVQENLDHSLRTTTPFARMISAGGKSMALESAMSGLARRACRASERREPRQELGS
eukprot:2342153-Prymnesium_polylepis.1